MRYKYREELPGKRFLCVSSCTKTQLSKISNWKWRVGIIRASSHKDPAHPELSVLLEFDDEDWKARRWVRVYDSTFLLFLVEYTLVWAPSSSAGIRGLLLPALNFLALVDKVNLDIHHLKPVEFVRGRELGFVNIAHLQGNDLNDSERGQEFLEVQQWNSFQESQMTLIDSPSKVIGNRVQVYRIAGAVQWYTAFISSCSQENKELRVTDDTVLEDHLVNPCLVQMMLIESRGRNWQDNLRNRNIEKQEEVKATDHKNLVRNNKFRKECSKAISVDGQNFCRKRSVDISTQKQLNIEPVQEECQLSKRNALILSKDTERWTGELKKESVKHTNNVGDNTNQRNTGLNSTYSSNRNNLHISLSDQPNNIKYFKEEHGEYFIVHEKETLKEAKQSDFLNSSIKAEAQSPNSAFSDFETVKLVDEKFIHQTVIQTYESILNKITECELPFRAKTAHQDLFIKGEPNKGDCKRTEIVTQSLPEPSVNKCINSTASYKHSKTQKELNRNCKKFSANSTQGDVINLQTRNQQNSHGKNLSIKVNKKFSDSLITRSTSLTSIDKKFSLPKIKNIDYLDIEYPIYSETKNKKCSNYISDLTIKKESTDIPKDKKNSSLCTDIIVNENVGVDTKISDFQAAINLPKVPISNKSSSLINESSHISTKLSSYFKEYELFGSTNVNKKLKNGCVIKNNKRELKIDTLAGLASKAKKIVTSQKGNEEIFSSDHPSVSIEVSENVIARCSVIQSVSDCIAKLKETCASELDIKVKRECSENTDHCEQVVATSDSTKRKQGDAIAKTEIAVSTTTNLTPMHPSRLGPNNRATSGMYSGITQEVQNHRSGLPPTHVPPFGISSTQLFRPHHIPSAPSGSRQISPLEQRILHSQPYRNFIPRHGVVLPHYGVEAMWHQKYQHMGTPPSNHWGNAQYHEDLRRKKERMTVRDLEKRSRFDRVKHNEKELYEKTQKSSHHIGKKEGTSAKSEKAVIEKKPEISTKSYVKENSNHKPLPSPSNQSEPAADSRKKDLLPVCTTTSSSSHGGEAKSLVNKLRSIPEKNKSSGCTVNSADKKNEQVLPTSCSVSGTESLDAQHSKSKAENIKINTCESSNSGSIIESAVSTTASCSQSSQETKFSLYGYQPFLHTYITAAELKANDITKTLTVNQSSAPGSPQLKEKGRNGQMLSSHSQVNSPASDPPPLSPKIPICDNEAALLSFNEVRTSKSCDLAPGPVAAAQSYNQPTSIKHSASDSQDKNSIPEEKSCQSDNPLACLSNLVSTTSNSITETFLTHSVAESDFGTHPSVSLECKVSPTQKDSYSTKQSTSRNSPCQINTSQFLEHNKTVGSPLGTSQFQRSTPPLLEAHSGCLSFSHRSPSPAHTSTASLGQISSNLSSGCQSPAHQSSHRYSPVVSLFKCDSSILGQTQPLNLQTISNTAGKHKNTDDILINSKRPRSLDSSLQPPCLQPEMKESTNIGKMANASPANSDSSKMITTTLSPVNSSCTSRFPLTLPLKVMTTVTPDVSDPNSPNQIPKSEKNGGSLESLQEQSDIQTPVSNTNCNTSGFLDSFRSFVSSAQSRPVTPQKKSRHRKRIKSSSPPPDDLSQSSSASLSNNGTPQHKGTASSVLSGSSGPHDSSDEARATPSPAPSTGTVFSGSSASSGTGHTKLKKTWLQRHSETEDIKQHKSKAQLEQSSEIDLHYKIDQERHFKHRRAKAICTDKLASKSHKKNDNKEENFQDSDTSSSASESIRVKRKKQIRRKNCVAAKESSANNCRHFGANSETQSDYTEESSFSSKKDEDKRYLCDRVSRRGGKAKKRGRPTFTHKKKIGKKPAINFQKRTRKPFLQHCPCFEIAPKLSKCRECRIAAYNRNKKIQNSYCRFLAYRKLYYTKNGTVLNAGFSEPSDAKDDDLKLWLPSQDNPPDDLNVETSKALLGHVGDRFCDLIEQEKEALSLHIGKDTTITWKRIVQGVREMCDVCDTTLFNLHWVCNKCGFAVCIDCYKGRKQGIVREDEDSLPKDRDEYQWLLCSGRQPHEQEKLIMTQIIAGSALWDMGKTLHKVREMWKIPSYCKCIPREEDESGSKYFSNGICKQLMSAVTKCFSTDKAVHMNSYSGSIHCTQRAPKRATNGVSGFLRNNADLKEFNSEIGDSALRWLADVALKTSGTLENENSLENDTKSQKHFTNCYDSCDDNSALRELLIQKPDKERNGGYPAPRKSLCSTLDDVIACVIEQNVGKGKSEEEAKLIHFSRRYPQPRSGHDPLPIRICTLTESTIMYPDVPHSWLCNGRLLLLHEPHNDKNLKLFQEQWKRGQPILVAKVSERLNMSLWHPDGFCRDFGEIRNDLVNCKTGSILPNLPMRKFWEGFENFSKRMKDEYGEYMLLKLKDWPPGEDFSEMLPLRFQDLMSGLPLPQYTHRDGILNLAGRLPSCFVRPDLGPKMYNAYGSALYPTKGTTNLHLDISDAVNVMVYVGIPYDGKDEDHIQEALKAIDEGGCDSLMRRRVRERGVRPGALWHIYNARDADKIRDLLNKVAIERGEKLEAHHDPIHDQSWYLDEELRERLYQEYGVEGYAIAQCLGDAVFIPAGAPHQVRNLHSCVKVAEDFVSPENIAHCFQLTQEFRNLSDTHTNHEDKLQIKNIIYHVVRDALAHLLAANHETGV